MRVDDDNSERIQQEVRAQDRKTQEQESKRRVGETTAFDRALRSKEQSPAVAQTRKQTGFSGKLSRQRKVSDEPGANLVSGDQGEEPGKGDALGQKRSLGAGEQQRTETLAQDDLRRDRDAIVGRDRDNREGERRLGSRKQEQRRQDATHEGNVGRGRSVRSGGRTEGANADGGNSNQQGSQQGGQQQAASFRLPNAALVAPPPVAVPRGAPAGETLRRLAQEIAQKIVQSARVGVNRMGLPEMQIELKSEVLHGLKVKISGRHGRVRAQFCSSDRQVLDQLRSGMVDLRGTLSARGLTVDALEIEEER